MSNITVTHSDSGLMRASVLRTERISPNFVRVTIGGEDFDRFRYLGFDQWFRLAIPVRESETLDRMPDRFGMGGFLRYLTVPKGVRPVVRNYTIRNFRQDSSEIDIDFVVHGTQGVAGPWAASVEPGFEVALIDQGCGWKQTEADRILLATDESGLPAVAGILRDLPANSKGTALIELFGSADQQELQAPEGVEVRWLKRSPSENPGSILMPELARLDFPADHLAAFAVGESSIATGVRRFLVNERGVPKANVIFSGYWKLGRATF
ncbi:MAG: siderophore-interacting protein [Cryobacterium sp.]|nr:siderophore-interacting protein [Cryobacterium sp.]